MTIDDVYKLELYIADKNQSGYITPEEFNRINNFAQRSYVSWLLGNFQQYQYGRPISRVELGQNSVVRQRLTPVIKTTNLNVTSGTASYPADYIQTDAMWTATGYKRIRYVDNDKYHGVVNSVIDPVADNPIYRLTQTGFEFAPTTLTSAKLSYISTPPDMVWAGTPDSNGRLVYNPGASVQPVWDETSMMDIIARAMEQIGVRLQSGAVVQYAKDIKQQGQ